MINLNEPCIIAPGKPLDSGYHRVRIGNRKVMRAHRFAYITIYGVPPLEKPLILHKCNNKACWNPSHLYAGTTRDNVIDMLKAGVHAQAKKTHCKRGHEFTVENTRVAPNSAGGLGRWCRACDRSWHNNAYAKIKKK